MAPKWLSKVPWTALAEFLLGWWNNRKEKQNDKDKTGGAVQCYDDGTPVDTSKTRPAA